MGIPRNFGLLVENGQQEQWFACFQEEPHSVQATQSLSRRVHFFR